MNLQAINCPNCRQPFPDDRIDVGMTRCRHCNKQVMLKVYPSLFRAHQELVPDELEAEEGDASCFYHEDKRAVTHCEVCGRFVCELCRVDLHARCVCPNCIQSNPKSNQIKELKNRHPLHHRMAFLLALLGLPFFMFGAASIASVVYSVLALRQKPAVYQNGSKTLVTTVASVSLLMVVGQLALGLFVWMKIYYSD